MPQHTPEERRRKQSQRDRFNILPNGVPSASTLLNPLAIQDWLNQQLGTPGPQDTGAEHLAAGLVGPSPFRIMQGAADDTIKDIGDFFTQPVGEEEQPQQRVPGMPDPVRVDLADQATERALGGSLSMEEILGQVGPQTTELGTFEGQEAPQMAPLPTGREAVNQLQEQFAQAAPERPDTPEMDVQDIIGAALQGAPRGGAHIADFLAGAGAGVAARGQEMERRRQQLERDFQRRQNQFQRQKAQLGFEGEMQVLENIAKNEKIEFENELLQYKDQQPRIQPSGDGVTVITSTPGGGKKVERIEMRDIEDVLSAHQQSVGTFMGIGADEDTAVRVGNELIDTSDLPQAEKTALKLASMVDKGVLGARNSVVRETRQRAAENVLIGRFGPEGSAAKLGDMSDSERAEALEAAREAYQTAIQTGRVDPLELEQELALKRMELLSQAFHADADFRRQFIPE